MTNMSQTSLLAAQKHIRFCLLHLQMLPTPYQTEDCNRMSLGFFVLSSLDLLNAIDKIATNDRLAWIDWIYEQQSPQGGFSGGPSLRTPEQRNLDPPHLAMTYTALAILAILGDNFSRLERGRLKSFIESCQMSDGSFAPYPGSSERDIRFVYCALVIWQHLGGAAPFRIQDAVQYVLNCQNYDGAFGQTPGSESQGGTTYCAIASLHLANRISALPARESTVRWLFQRLVSVEAQDIPHEQDGLSVPSLGMLNRGDAGGFQGRPEKDADVCYCFWVAASLLLLRESLGLLRKSPHSLVDGPRANIESLKPEKYEHFIYAAQDTRGGISKYFEEPPDVYHTYLGLAGLALRESSFLNTMNPELNMCCASARRFAAPES